LTGKVGCLIFILRTERVKKMTTLKIGRLEFTVTSEKKVQFGQEVVVYTLKGQRGAEYFTMRNAHKPHMMFLGNARKFGPASQFQGTWLTDKNGKLEVV
jgi:hypothetical protein